MFIKLEWIQYVNAAYMFKYHQSIMHFAAGMLKYTKKGTYAIEYMIINNPLSPAQYSYNKINYKTK